MTAEEFARASGTALVIAKERLLAAENLGKLCRDDTIEGLTGNFFEIYLKPYFLEAYRPIHKVMFMAIT